MTPEQFAYWLHGFVELTQGQTPNPAQWKSICEHLEKVFTKVTPPVGETKVKVEVDTKGAQKAIEDLRKAWEEARKDASPFPKWDPHFQPYWLAPRPGDFPPGTVLCMAASAPSSTFTC